MPHAANLYPHELSGGMKRRMVLVRAMANEPKLGLFDNQAQDWILLPHNHLEYDQRTSFLKRKLEHARR